MCVCVLSLLKENPLSSRVRKITMENQPFLRAVKCSVVLVALTVGSFKCACVCAEQGVEWFFRENSSLFSRLRDFERFRSVPYFLSRSMFQGISLFLIRSDWSDGKVSLISVVGLTSSLSKG